MSHSDVGPVSGSSVALATCRELADLWAGDRLLLDELRRRRFRAAPLVWDDEQVDWRAWDLVIIRSCWDYHLKADRFRAWIDRLDAAGVRVVNPPDVVRWNLHKRYLLDVARAGGRIPSTRVVSAGTSSTLHDEMRGARWSAAVIKPAVSASGYCTRLIRGTPSGEDERAYAALLASGDVLLQEYIPEVREHGEWSLIFFAGRYSHAALKRAADGEFRVHIEWGGTVETADPPAALVRQAQALVENLNLAATYARVDGTDVGGELMVMEVELIEPELFFDRHPEATARLADAIQRQ